MYAVVAGSLAHANALIKWAGLDAEKCVPLVYGQEIRDAYERAVLVRPTEGVDPSAQAWICGTLLPQVADRDLVTHPPYWRPYHDTERERISADAVLPQIEENPLWA